MTQAFDGEEGLERLARESFDVIILDVMMPRLNGYEVLEQMRGGGITTPVLMLTALGQASDQVKDVYKRQGLPGVAAGMPLGRGTAA